MNYFKKIILSATLFGIIFQSVFLATANAQQDVISRAATQTERIAAATARQGAAVARFAIANAAMPIPGFVTYDAGLRLQEFAAAQQELVIANTEVLDAQRTVAEDILEVLEKVLFESLKKKILDMVVDQIIGYIQGEGSPRFITDWQGFFSDIAQGAVGDLAQGLGLGFLCSPFSIPVRLQIAAGIAPIDRFKAKFNCSLDQIVDNIENFYEDFRAGGWKAYDVAWQPQNNYYGAIWLAWDEEQNMIANRLFAAANEAIAGGGYLGVRKCYDDAGNEVSSDVSSNCRIVTPGKALGDLAAKAVGADIDFIVNSNDLSTYIASITNALINRFIKEGVGLLGVSTPSAPQKTRTTDIAGAIYNSRNIPGGVNGTINQYKTSIDQKTGAASGQVGGGPIKNSLTSQIEEMRDIRFTARTLLTQRMDLEDDYLSQLKSLKACYDAKRSSSASRTQTLITDQTAVIENLQQAITNNQLYLTRYNEALTELERLTEAQVAARLSEFQALAVGLTEAQSTRDEAERGLRNAQTTLPTFINQTGDELQKCLR